MAASQRVTPPLTDRDIQFQKYFTALAPNYHHLTSNTTSLVAQKAIEIAPIPNDASALLHDNASGPGTATLAILAHCTSTSSPTPAIIATDYTPAMISNLPQHDRVQASVQDSQSLPYPDHHFAYTICNVSLANFTAPDAALREMHRTARPGAQTVVTHWKVFAPSVLLHRAQEIFRGGEPQPPPPVAGRDLMHEGVMAEMMVEAGWERGKVRTHVVEVVSEETEGMVEFLTGPFLPMVRGLPEGEQGNWKVAVERAVGEVGVVRCEAWVVVGRK